jgi:hypothetical protein
MICHHNLPWKGEGWRYENFPKAIMLDAFGGSFVFKKNCCQWLSKEVLCGE